MISSICQGLQSYIEPQVLSFSSRPNATKEDEVEEISKSSNTVRINGNGWSFLEAVSHACGVHENEEEEKVYGHPAMSSKLSKKSLEMCTEGLGSESGSELSETDMFLMSMEGEETRESKRMVKKENIRRKSSFPPPLTSISGSTGVRVESHREDGRLVVRAVAISASGRSCFHAERGHGRLKLQMVKEFAESSGKEDEEDNEVYEEEEEEEEEGFSSEGDEEGGYWNGDTEENDGKDGEEMGMEKLGKTCRCKEGRHESKELLNWEPLWVST